MSAERRDALEEYFAQSRGWAADRRRQTERVATQAWWVAGVACAFALLLAGALLLLVPLKRVEPYLVRVDAATGIVEVVPRYEGGVELPEAVTRWLLTQYVTARERFVLQLAEADYERVGALQAASLNQAWAALWDRQNPESPLNRHRDGSHADVQVQSVTFLSPASGTRELAQVRFRRSVRHGGGEQTRHYLATLRFEYGRPAADPRQRALNPLGFRVTEYRTEPELGVAEGRP